MPDSSAAAPGSEPSRARRVLAWGAGLVGGLAILVLAVALVLPRLFTSEQLKGYVVPPLEDATGRQVEIDDIGLRVLPLPAIRVSGFRLANAEGPGPAPAVEARALNVDVALWPLFVGRIRPTAVGLDAPVIRYEVAEDGTTNFGTLGGEADTTEAEGPPLGGVPLSNVRVSDAQLHYTDRSTGQAVRLDFGAQLGAGPEGAALTSSGTVELTTVRALLPSVAPDTLVLQDAQATYDVQVAPSAGTVALRTLRLDTAPLTLSVTGTVTGLNDRPTLDLSIETGDTDLAEVAAFVPAAAVDGLTPQGTLSLTATVSGRPSDTTGARPLTVAGRGHLSGVGADYNDRALLRDLSADLVLSPDSAALQSVQGQMLGGTLSGRVAIRGLRDRPRVVGRLAGAADLPRAATWAAVSEESAVEGTAEYDVRFAGPLDAPGALRPRGQIRLTDVQVPYTSFRAPLEIPSTTVDLAGTGLATNRFTVRSGTQTVSVRASVQNLFPVSRGLAMPDPALSATFSLAGDRLDLGTLYPEPDTGAVHYSDLFAAHLSGASLNGQSPESVAEGLYGGVELPAYAVEGRVEIDTLINDPQRYENLAMDVRLENRRLALRNVAATTYGGALRGRLTLDQGAPPSSAARKGGQSVLLAAAQPGRAPPPPSSTLTYDVELQDAQAGAVLRDWTSLGRFVTGTLTLDADGSTPLTTGLLPEAAAFRAIGRSLVANGGLSLDVGPAQALTEALKLPIPSLQQFGRLGGPFTIRDGQFQLDTWEFRGPQFEGRVQGALGLGGRMDLQMTMELPVSALQQSNLVAQLGGDGGPLRTLVERLAGGPSADATVPVTVRLGGTMRAPTATVLNQDAVRGRIRSLAKEAGLDALRNFFGGGG